MPIVPLFGHEALRARLEHAARRGTLPGSLLLLGPAGIGKQRLALHLAQVLLCGDAAPPCGACQGCRYSAELTHPDLHWYFPRLRPKDTDPSAADVESDYRESVAERVQAHGLYPRPAGLEGLFVATVRAMLHQASRSPAMARRKVFVVGDAERMAPQEGSEQAANAFLKLLEEPPGDTTLILTSSEPGALLPTVRSRVVSVRMAPLPDAAMRSFLDHELVRASPLVRPGSMEPLDERLRLAAGAPGRLLDGQEQSAALGVARRLVEAAESGSRARWLRAAFALGSLKARGGFAGALDPVAVLLHERVQAAVRRGDDVRAVRLGGAVLAVEEARERARANTTPQLAGATLARAVAGALR